MRLNRLLAVIIPSVAACGGGGNKPPVIIDAPPQVIDTPTATACPVVDDLMGLALIGGAGTDGMAGTADDVPIGANACGAQGTSPCNWFQVPTAGPNTGSDTFFIFAGLPADVDNDPTTTSDNVMGVELVSTSGAFILNQATNFATAADLSVATIAFEPNQQGSTSYQAAAYLFGNVDGSGAFTHLYFASSGAITLTEGSDNPNTVIKGSVSTTAMREVDGTADVAGGCTTSLGGLAFALTQGQATFQQAEGDNLSYGMKLYKNLHQRLDQIKNK